MTIYSDSRSLKKPNKYVLTKKKKQPQTDRGSLHVKTVSVCDFDNEKLKR